MLYSGSNQSQIHSNGGETEERKTIYMYSLPCLQYSCHVYREGCLGTCFTGFEHQNSFQLDPPSLCLRPKKSSLLQPYQEEDSSVRKRGGLILYSTCS